MNSMAPASLRSLISGRVTIKCVFILMMWRKRHFVHTMATLNFW
jgi:hypothetical protein